MAFVIRSAGGPGGRGDFRQKWQGATVRRQIAAAIQGGMDDLAKSVLADLHEQLHKVSHEMADKAFARVEIRGGKRTLTAGSEAGHTAYHELGTSNFEGHPQIRQIMDRRIPEVTELIRRRMPG